MCGVAGLDSGPEQGLVWFVSEEKPLPSTRHLKLTAQLPLTAAPLPV